ncbi:MAG TPA: IS1380 family transposase [Candidatus Tenderia sp.]|nr:IS1380 family transposase [Candidatus Tenderia sp.]
MPRVQVSPAKIEIDFTDEKLTSHGGWVFLGHLFRKLQLGKRIGRAIRLKQRRRGASDAQVLLSLVASQVAGGGALSDVDVLREDTVSQILLGLDRVPDSRRLGEYLSRFTETGVVALEAVVQSVAQEVIPAVIAHEVAQRGYLPVFVDGSAIEVDGHLFEGAAKGYNGQVQYWLHGVFLGGAWAAGQLHPGGVSVIKGWRSQLESVAPWINKDTPVWVHVDNAYYNHDFVDFCHARGWDYSVSVTHDGFRRPVLESIEGLPDTAWTDIGLGEEATLTRHRPQGWREQTYIVIRRTHDGPQRRLRPAYTVILVSRDDLPLEELVRRHRQKQGQENAFKGPLIDLDLHHPPCRSFHANQAYYLCGQLAQLLLRLIQYRLLPPKARRHGIRPLIRHLIRTAARLVRSARRWRLDFSKTAFRLDWLYHAACQLE